MKNIVVLVKNNLKRAILIKPFSFLISLIGPFLILLVFINFNLIGAGYIKVGLIQEEESLSAISIREELEKYEGFSILDIEEENREKLLSEREVNVVVKIKEGFEENLFEENKIRLVEVYTIEGSGEKNIINDLIDGEIRSLVEIANSTREDKNLYYESLEEYTENKEASLSKKSLNDLYGDYLNSSIFIGFIISSILNKGYKHASRIFVEKEDFIYNRIFMAPVKTYEYYVADVLSGIIDVVLQTVLTIIGINLLKVNMGISTHILFVILILVGILGLSMCICLRTFTKNRNELSNIYNFIYITLIMTGGLFVPLDVLPKVVNKIAYFNPIRWAGESISKIQQGSNFDSIIFNLVIILLFSLVFLLIGIYRTKNEDKSNVIL